MGKSSPVRKETMKAKSSKITSSSSSMKESGKTKVKRAKITNTNHLVSSETDDQSTDVDSLVKEATTRTTTRVSTGSKNKKMRENLADQMEEEQNSDEDDSELEDCKLDDEEDEGEDDEEDEDEEEEKEEYSIEANEEEELEEEEDEGEEEGGGGRGKGGERERVQSKSSSGFDYNSTSHPPLSYDGNYKNKQRVLVFASRGITARYRHLLDDLRKLIPHHKKDVKLDTKGNLQVINEIAEMKSCNNCLFLESRKKQDLYMWISKSPFGPSVKFHVQNVHTMDELKLTGNSMLGSRPILNFENNFDDAELNPHLHLLKLMFMDTFGTPRGHPKSKPFIDRIMSFSISDDRIWIRNYQIVDRSEAGKLDAKAFKQGKLDEITSLVEIGPRFCLNPIRIFSGSFGGPTLYQNPSFVSPNFLRAETKRSQGKQMANQLHNREDTKKRKEAFELTPNEINDVFK